MIINIAPIALDWIVLPITILFSVSILIAGYFGITLVLFIPCLISVLLLFRFIMTFKSKSIAPIVISILCSILDICTTFYVSAIKMQPNFYESNPLFRFAFLNLDSKSSIAILSLYKFIIFLFIVHAFLSSLKTKRRHIKRYNPSEVYRFYQGDRKSYIMGTICDAIALVFTGSVKKKIDRDYISKARIYKVVIQRSYVFMIWLSLYIPLNNLLFLTNYPNLVLLASYLILASVVAWLAYIYYQYREYYRFHDKDKTACNYTSS